MTNLLGKAADWLERQRRKHLTTAVWYERDGQRIGVPATIGKSEFESADAYGRLLRTESRDYLVWAADLVIDGVMFLPRAGDRLREGDRCYEVMAPAGEPEWRWSDLNQQTLRIHTKQTEG